MSKEGQYQSNQKQYRMSNVLNQKKDTNYQNSSTGIDTVDKNNTITKSDQ